MKYFLVPAEIAERGGRTGERYHTEDGRYILNEQDMNGLRLEPEEFISGLSGVEVITESEAMSLIDKPTTVIDSVDEEELTEAGEEQEAADEQPAEDPVQEKEEE